MAAQTSKAMLRDQVKRTLRTISAEDRAVQSKAICQHLLNHPTYRDARKIVAYLACQRLREVDTAVLIDDILAKGGRLYVPVVEDRASNMSMLHLNSLQGVKDVPPFGIHEPTPLYTGGALAGEPRAELMSECAALGHQALPDVVAVPGLAFDSAGGRLGRGGGYYDKFLQCLREAAASCGVPPPPLVGLCFREQLLDLVPMAAHDQRCDWVITPDGAVPASPADIVPCGLVAPTGDDAGSFIG